ncbi:hypothetical protein PVL29_003925 [Vitis rotundifolia]|uniref:Uncharacterized protein n=2 Tax=Vitis TaxID=3603 RepID=A5BVL3_VITVI|nr:hypothetical protein PVL29_003925 [Vitis rotundifolia]CAN70605.1 hypothetical protein VITISV_040195 [Vitis vinifera]
MASSLSGASLIALMVFSVAILSSVVAAQDLAPAPSPASSAGAISPSFAAGCAVAVVAFVFGSVMKA